MKNIALAIDGNTCRQARVWVAKRGTSVSAAVAALLENLPGRSHTLCVSAAKPGAIKPKAPSFASILRKNASFYAYFSHRRMPCKQLIKQHLNGNATAKN